MGNLESLGDAVTGGLIGRAVEPGTGKAGDHTNEGNCLNCGAELTGPYCGQCGQKAHVHRSLSGFFHDLLHGVLHFEGKIWRTLPLLAWRPGELTRDYIDGRRASFISPIALFLFCVFLMFAVGTITGGLDLGDNPALKQDLNQELADAKVEIAKLEARRSRAVAANQPTAHLDRRIHSEQEEVHALEALQSKGVSIDKADLSKELPGWLRDGIGRAADNPDLIFYKLKTNTYKFSWALIPLSVPFLWLLFPFSRRFHLYDHTVFVTYSLCFMSMLVIAGMLFGWVGLGAISGFLALIPPFHMYRQLKGTYGLSRFGALWRAIFLTIFAFVAAALFITLVAGIGIAG